MLVGCEETLNEFALDVKQKAINVTSQFEDLVLSHFLPLRQYSSFILFIKQCLNLVDMHHYAVNHQTLGDVSGKDGAAHSNTARNATINLANPSYHDGEH